MGESDTDAAPGRIGRPPKVDAEGTPTRERLLRAAIDACVEFGYEGATLADIARRAEVSTPAVYSHFDSKAALLVEASKHALDELTTSRLPGGAGLREIARYWLRPDFASTRILVAELHCAAIRQPEVAALLAEWQRDNAQRMMRLAGLDAAQAKLYYLMLIGLSHTDEVGGVDVSQQDLERRVDAIVEGWFAASASDPDC